MNKEQIQQRITKIQAELESLKTQLEDKYIPKFGEICEVTDFGEFPEYPHVCRFHSIDDQDKFRSLAADGKSIGASWRYYRPLKTS